MNLNFSVRNLTLSPRQQEYVIEKIERLKKYGDRLADESTQAKVDIERDLKHNRGPVILFTANIFVPGTTLRAEVRGATVEEACDLAYDKLKAQAETYKARYQSKHTDDLTTPD